MATRDASISLYASKEHKTILNVASANSISLGYTLAKNRTQLETDNY